jgi:hypothetical protein
MKIVNFLFLLIFLVNISSLKSQLIEPEQLINNIKEKIYKPTGYDNIYFDLNKKSIVNTGDFEVKKTVEEIVGYEAKVYGGSFLNKNEKEYLLHLKWNSPEKYFSFPHVANFGPLNQFIVFDKDYNQISKINFQDATRELKEIVDIGNTGLNEIFMEGTYWGQGMCENYIEIFFRNFEEPILSYYSELKCVECFLKEYNEEVSSYKIENDNFIVNITKYSYLKLSDSDIRKVKESNCQVIYKFKDGKFNIISGKDCELEGY